MHPILFKIGPLTLYSYGLAIALGFLLASWLAGRRARAVGMDPARVQRIALTALLAGLAGGRAAYVFLSWQVYAADPLEILRLDHGGLVYYGGFAAGVLAGALAIRAAKLPVLATLDLQVHSYWQTFIGGYSYIPDRFVAAVPDSVADVRLLRLGKILGMETGAFAGFLQQPATQVFWLSSSKYQASRAHAFGDISAYTPEQAAQITRTSVFHNWNLIVPPPELDRLRTEYEQLDTLSPPPRLDGIVLTKREWERGWNPDSAAFILAYANPTFRVWKKRIR
jgi:hypothetical protein